MIYSHQATYTGAPQELDKQRETGMLLFFFFCVTTITHHHHHYNKGTIKNYNHLSRGMVKEKRRNYRLLDLDSQAVITENNTLKTISSKTYCAGEGWI